MSELIVAPMKELKNLNGMNSTKVGGIILLFVSLFFYFLGEEYKKDRIKYLGIVGIVIGSLWMLYAAALALMVVAEKGGIAAFYRWEWANLRDTLLAANTKAAFFILLLLGLGLFFAAEDGVFTGDLKDKVKYLGIAAIVVGALYGMATSVIGIKLLGKK